MANIFAVSLGITHHCVKGIAAVLLALHSAGKAPSWSCFSW